MTVIAILLAFVPGLAWLFFYLREDHHPEPKRLIFAVFGAGIASAFLALPIQYLLDHTLSEYNLSIALTHDGALAGAWIAILPALLLFALTEEVVKFFAAWLAVRNDPAFDEPVDAMIYAVVAGLGFATIENLGVLGGAPSQGALLSEIFGLASLRFVGATLLHSLASGIVGYAWAMSIRRFGSSVFIAGGIVAATVLHTLFNFLILIQGSVTTALLILLVAGFFVFGEFESLNKRSV